MAQVVDDLNCPRGDDALLIERTSGTVVFWLDRVEQRRSREARLVLLDPQGGSAYKIFTKEDQAKEARDASNDAREAGIATPQVELFAGKLRIKNRCENVWVLKARFVDGNFFQFAKPGHVQSLLARVIETEDSEISSAPCGSVSMPTSMA